MEKSDINEIVNDDGHVIKKTNTQPEVAYSNDSGSSRGSDHNIAVGRQSYASDYLVGRLGYNFLESDDNGNDKLVTLLDKLAELEFDQYKERVKYFLNNLNKDEIKKYKETLDKKFSDLTDEERKSDYDKALSTIKLIKNHLKEKEGKKTIEEVDDFISKDSKRGGFIKKNESSQSDESRKQLNGALDMLIKRIKTGDDLAYISNYIFRNTDADIMNITLKNKIISGLNNILEVHNILNTKK